VSRADFRQFQCQVPNIAHVLQFLNPGKVSVDKGSFASEQASRGFFIGQAVIFDDGKDSRRPSCITAPGLAQEVPPESVTEMLLLDASSFDDRFGKTDGHGRVIRARKFPRRFIIYPRIILSSNLIRTAEEEETAKKAKNIDQNMLSSSFYC
jgi:hypothetical protein